MTGRVIDIRFELTPQMRRRAIVEMSRSSTPNAKGIKGIAMQLIMGIGMALVVGVLSHWFLPAYNPGIVVLIFGAGFWTCLFLWHYTFSRQVAQISADYSDPQPTRVIAEQGGLQIISDMGDTRVQWGAVRDVSVLSDMVLIRMRGQGLPIPVAALPEGDTPRQVADQLNAWRTGA